MNMISKMTNSLILFQKIRAQFLISNKQYKKKKIKNSKNNQHNNNINKNN